MYCGQDSRDNACLYIQVPKDQENGNSNKTYKPGNELADETYKVKPINLQFHEHDIYNYLIDLSIILEVCVCLNSPYWSVGCSTNVGIIHG